MKWFKRLLKLLVVLLLGPLIAAACGNVRLDRDWRTADRTSAGLAPDPETNRQAVVQVYAARAFNWRGIFAVHTWIAAKPEDALEYQVYQVIGWRLRGGNSVVAADLDVPDRNWFGATPEVIGELRGPAAARAIPKIQAAVASYPYTREYVLWPGPNSNTFIAHVLREVPELDVALPVTAIGKDYLPGGALIDKVPSGTGYQFSLFGVAGIMGGLREGLEFNLLTLNFGIDALRPAIKLPGIGRLGMSRGVAGN